ncbi:MAG: hypothetical protein H7123_04275, partial [Thermoleophilia bacterium]|nr:hypothetical protein [Thermoleophilia bacterium]
VAAQYSSRLDEALDARLPASSQHAVTEAKRRTFAKIDPSQVPASQRQFVLKASARASRDAFHRVAAVGSGLMLLTALGGLLIRNRRRSVPDA